MFSCRRKKVKQNMLEQKFEEYGPLEKIIISIKHTQVKIYIYIYICKDREVENTLRNNSIFKQNKLSLVNYKESTIHYIAL